VRLDLLSADDLLHYVVQISLLEAEALVPEFFPMRMRGLLVGLVVGGLGIEDGGGRMKNLEGIDGLGV